MPSIVQLSVCTHCNDIGGKVWNPAIKWTQKYAVFIALIDNEGHSGIGECWCFDTAPDALVAFIKTEVAPQVLGMDIEAGARLMQQSVARATLTARHGMLASALSGVDIALWDLRSRRAHKPLWAFLQTEMCSSAQHHGEVYLYGSGGLYGEEKTSEDLALEMQGLNQFHFNVVKMKIGALPLADDLKRVHAVLNKLDDTAQLIIDGVYSYTIQQAQEIYTALPKDRIEAFQSPIPAHDLSGMQLLTASGVPVMASEAEYRQEIHQQLIRDKTVQFLQVSPIACGGLSRLIELQRLIKAQGENGIKLSLEISSTAIALSAACHFAAASETVAHTEFHTIHQVFFDKLNITAIEGRTGWFQLPDSQGLGIVLPKSDIHCEFEMNQASV